jgi:hypothetical protein
MGLDDAFDNRKAKTHPCVVDARPLTSPLKWFSECRYKSWAELLTGVFDNQLDVRVSVAGGDPHSPLVGQVVHDGVVDQVRRHLLKQSGRPDRVCNGT